MRISERVSKLTEENAVLREKLTSRLKLDREWHTDLPDCIFAVAKNISMLNQVNRERVLLGVAVLYGIIGPEKTPPATTLPIGTATSTEGQAK